LTLSGHNDVVSRCSFNKESNQVLTGSYDKTCKIFDLNNGNELFNFTDHTKEITNCYFYPNDNNIIITTSLDGLCKIYDIRNGSQSLKTFDEHNKKEILCSTLSSNGKYLATG
jgi:WD40 repeat protein